MFEIILSKNLNANAMTLQKILHKRNPLKQIIPLTENQKQVYILIVSQDALVSYVKEDVIWYVIEFNETTYLHYSIESTEEEITYHYRLSHSAYHIDIPVKGKDF